MGWGKLNPIIQATGQGHEQALAAADAQTKRERETIKFGQEQEKTANELDLGNFEKFKRDIARAAMGPFDQAKARALAQANYGLFKSALDGMAEGVPTAGDMLAQALNMQPDSQARGQAKTAKFNPETNSIDVYDANGQKLGTPIPVSAAFLEKMKGKATFHPVGTSGAVTMGPTGDIRERIEGAAGKYANRTPGTPLEYADEMVAQAVAQGSASLPSKRKTEVYNAIVARAREINPNWNSGMRPAKEAFSKLWVSGQPGSAGAVMKGANLVFQHLELFDKTIAALQAGDIPAFNALGNAISRATGGAKVTDFKTVRDAVATEVAKILRGAGSMSQQEIEEWSDNVKASASEQQLRHQLSIIAHIVYPRLEAVEVEADRVMGPDFRKQNPGIPPGGVAAIKHFFPNYTGGPHPGTTPQGAPQGTGGVQAPPSQTMQQGTAPQEALDYLRAHPDTLQQFIDTFHYKPEGY